jgi:hypothetical protein
MKIAAPPANDAEKIRENAVNRRKKIPLDYFDQEKMM